jgi:hypothetical protein
MNDGRIRDTICYSIIKPEWEEVKINLIEKLSKYDDKQDLY